MKKNPPLTFVAAVSEFEAARQNLAAFRQANLRVLEELELLISAHNTALSEAKAQYKQHAAKIGKKYHEFRITQSTVVDADRLLQLCPNARPAIVSKIGVDRKAYKELVGNGVIPQEVVEEVESPGSISVYGPKPA